MTAFAWLVLLAAVPASRTPSAPLLPERVERIVLHTLGGPFYRDPEWRFRFLSPPETFARWKKHFGAHWIVAPDGSLWPRHPRSGEPASRRPRAGPPDTREEERLAVEAAPVYAHVHGANDDSVGIELAHSGRSDDPFPPEQVRTVAWLVQALLALSRGRLEGSAVLGHKDLDKRPAYEPDDCRDGCPFYADETGRAYRRRVDPPEGLFVALAGEGLALPRGGREGDEELLRAEAIPERRVPRLIR